MSTQQDSRIGVSDRAPGFHPEETASAVPSEPTRYPTVLHRYRRISVALAITDVLCLTLALTLSYLIRFGTSTLNASFLLVVAVAPFIWVAVFHAYRLFTPRDLSSLEEFRRIISAVCIGVFLLVMTSFWAKASFSRVWMGLILLFALVLELLARRVWRGYLARQTAAGRLALRTLIVGDNTEADELARALQAEAHLGFLPVGYVSTDRQLSSANHVPILGSVEYLAELIPAHGVECLFVASTAVSPAQMMMVAQAARRQGAEVKVSANLPQILTSRVSVQQLGSVMTLSLKAVRLSGTQALMKRTFDVLVSGLALVVFSPILLGVAVALKLTSKESVLYKQERVTEGGRPFALLKFRTMSSATDEKLRLAGLDTSKPFFKLESDPRVTRVGGFLRRWSLDELPQLINVMKDEMSLVGPRPLPADQVSANLELLSPRCDVKAGVTGWWQVHGRDVVTAEEAVAMDTFYIENWSLTLDFWVLMKTMIILTQRSTTR